MGQQMTELDRRLVTVTIQKANPCPEDVSACMALLQEKQMFSVDKALAFWEEYLQVCQQALHDRHDMDARPPTPPTRDISPPKLADPMPDTLHSHLRAAIDGSWDMPIDSVHMYNSGMFHFANVKFTNAEFSYILERTVKDRGLECRNGIVQIGWKDSNLPPDADHIGRTAVLISVSEEDPLRVEMKVDIFFGKHCREERGAQLQAVRAAMNIQSASSPFEGQPDDSYTDSVAEAASPPMQALDSVAEAASLPSQALDSVPSPFDCDVVFMGPNAAMQAAIFATARDREAARLSEAVGRKVHVPAWRSRKDREMDTGTFRRR